MNKVLRGLARAVSLLAAVAVAAVIILYQSLMAEDSTSVPQGYLVELAFDGDERSLGARFRFRA